LAYLIPKNRVAKPYAVANMQYAMKQIQKFYQDQMATLAPIYDAKMPAGGGMDLNSLSQQADAVLKSRQPKQ
jgi:hypothetical protein